MSQTNKEKKPSPVNPASAPSPEADLQKKITPPVISPPVGKKKSIRASEVIIIIAIIFGIIICGLMIWGVIALFQHIPEWWRNLFGYLGNFTA